MKSSGLILVYFLLCYPTFGVAADHRLALVIGNQNYRSGLGGPLNNPIKDAALVFDSLTADGFMVEQRTDLNQKQIFDEIKFFGERLRNAGDGAVGFFYYSGHGFGRPDNKQNYIVPVELEGLSDSFSSYKAVPLTEIINTLRNAAPKAALFIVFDACRNKLHLPTKAIINSFFDISYEVPPETFITFSTKPGEVASDEGSDGGPYAKALAAELRHPGINHISLFEYVRRNVGTFTHNTQQPWSMPNSIDRDIFFSGPPQSPQIAETSEVSVQPKKPDARVNSELDRDSPHADESVVQPTSKSKRELWAERYLVPTPGDPTGTLGARSWGVVVSSFETAYYEDPTEFGRFSKRSVDELKYYCKKFPDFDFTLLGSYDPQSGRGFNQIEIAYNLTKKIAYELATRVKQEVAPDAWARPYSWKGYTTSAIHCAHVSLP